MNTQPVKAGVPAGESLLARVKALRELIEAKADVDEEATQPADEVLEALMDAGVFTLLAPRGVGGQEAHPREVLDVLKALAYFDGSVGWYCQAALTGPAIAGAFLGDRAIEAIFCSGGRPTCSGQAAPKGKAERVAGGYRICGSFNFGSGIPTASWIVGGYTLHENGAPVLRDNGQPVMLIALAPRSKVELLGNWNVLGLRATGSYDFRVLDQVVHSDFVFDPVTQAPRRGGALYGMGFLSIPHLCHAGFGIGCGARVLDEWVAYARAKQRPPAGLLHESEIFQKDLARAHAAMRSAEAYARKSFDALFESAEHGGAPPEAQLDAKLSTANVIAVAADTAQTAFTSSATTGLRNGSRIQRFFRDAQAGNAHVMTGELSWIGSGRYLAGLPTPLLDLG